MAPEFTNPTKIYIYKNDMISTFSLLALLPGITFGTPSMLSCPWTVGKASPDDAENSARAMQTVRPATTPVSGHDAGQHVSREGQSQRHHRRGLVRPARRAQCRYSVPASEREDELDERVHPHLMVTKITVYPKSFEIMGSLCRS